MREDLFSPDPRAPWRRRLSPAARVRSWHRLRRHDRFGAELAAAHTAIGVVTEAALLVELGWAAGHACTACPAGKRHGGATGSHVCLAAALRIAANSDVAAGRRAVDLVWQQLHRGRPRRTVHWHSPATRHTLQVQDLRDWNDHPARSAAETAALVRATLRTARSDLDRARTAACPPVPADA